MGGSKVDTCGEKFS